MCVCELSESVYVLEHPYHLNGSTYPHVSVVEVQETDKRRDAHSIQQ